MYLNFEINEKLYYNDETTKIWTPISQLKIFYRISEAKLKEFSEDSNYLLKLKKIIVIKSVGNYELNEKKEINIDFRFDFHYYRKKMFKSSIFSNNMNSKQIPENLLVFSNFIIRRIVGNLTIIGGNLSNKSKNIFEDIISALYGEIRFSEIGIKDQFQLRIKDLTLIAYKDLIRFVAKCNNLFDNASIKQVIYNWNK